MEDQQTLQILKNINLRKIFVFIIFVVLIFVSPILFSCGEAKTPIESRNTKDCINEDSVEHLRIQSKLRQTEGDTIVGGIYFGMSPHEYDREVKKIHDKCGGEFYDLILKGNEFKFLSPSFHNDKLYMVRLEGHCGCLMVSMMFDKKYGKHTSTFYNPTGFAWEFDFKVIEVIVYGGKTADQSTKTEIRIFKPSILEEIKAENEQKENERLEEEEKHRQKSAEYANQL